MESVVAADTELLEHELLPGNLEVEVSVAGAAVDPGRAPGMEDCAHDSAVMTDSLVAFIKGDDGAVLEWQLRVRAQCGNCGHPFLIAPTGRVPRDGSAGVVLALAPVEAPVPDLSELAAYTDGSPESQEDAP